MAGSSGDVTRHRLSRAGDRQLNCCLHTMAITQIAPRYPRGPTTAEKRRRKEPPRSVARS
ncbi:transposase [Mycolicibacterium mengxianglii]|uniref:transposase n=1 Tax=Mycolicibacterium mengxianglii TaxID=2736649 RepID=UPI001E484163|nr:transposase [Mycolicibacterium mengxianglii]